MRRSAPVGKRWQQRWYSRRPGNDRRSVQSAGLKTGRERLRRGSRWNRSHPVPEKGRPGFIHGVPGQVQRLRRSRSYYADDLIIVRLSQGYRVGAPESGA
jgi:hypothetical protein